MTIRDEASLIIGGSAINEVIQHQLPFKGATSWGGLTSCILIYFFCSKLLTPVEDRASYSTVSRTKTAQIRLRTSLEVGQVN